MEGVVLLNGLLFGLGLAVDAFLIALANGLNYPDIKKRKVILLSALFAAAQIIMPMLGWLCMHTISLYIPYFDEVLSWVAFAVMLWIGIKMIIDGVKKRPLEQKKTSINVGAVILQCFATSIDSLAVGFTLASYTALSAIVSSVIIAAVTFVLFILGFIVGRRCGMKFADSASVIGGIVFIGIGIEILLTSLLA
ncbi:MAG: manganese efflux pump MntP family protein [Clostridiales bacterium]|nr:manganese efflux pump MntP family protein [Clostridiales bacterium]